MELVVPALVNLIAGIAIVTGFAFLIWWIIGLYAVHDRKAEHELPEMELPGHIHEVFAGVPPVLVIFYIFIGVWMIGYFFYIWLSGVIF